MSRKLGLTLAFLGVVYVTSWPARAVAYISFGYYRLRCMRLYLDRLTCNGPSLVHAALQWLLSYATLDDRQYNSLLVWFCRVPEIWRTKFSESSHAQCMTALTCVCWDQGELNPDLATLRSLRIQSALPPGVFSWTVLSRGARWSFPPEPGNMADSGRKSDGSG